MTIDVHSSVFDGGEPIPTRYTRDGANLSPPLQWRNLPPHTRELAVIVDDPDSPSREPFVHWVAYKISAQADGIPEGVAPKVNGSLPGAQGRNSFGRQGYDGPAPPRGHGPHHYHIHVYALDQPLPEMGRLDKGQLVNAMRGHILDEGELVGIYERV